MEKCKNCGGYSGEPRKVKIGEKCNFTLETMGLRAIRCRNATGTLFLILTNGEFSVKYRGTIYRVTQITHPDDPSPLTLLFCGRCACPQEAAK